MAMDGAVQIACMTVLIEMVSSTIVGLSYMDSLNLVPSKPPRGEDPCHPLYWYPRQIPDYCYFPKPDPVLPPVRPPPVPLPPPKPLPIPQPMPNPMPMPMPMPIPMPMFVPMPGPLMPMPMPAPLPMPMPIPAYGPPAPVPMEYPGYPPNSYPSPGLPYPVPAIQSGLLPGVDGLVSSDGAINILPFSDAYSDLLEKHKQKMIRRRLQKLLDEYGNFPKKRRCNRKYGCRY